MRSPTDGTASNDSENDFQSTGSLRSPTLFVFSQLFLCNLSIHRLLAEPDNYLRNLKLLKMIFQSTGSLRSPTTSLPPFWSPFLPFQSTGSLRSPTHDLLPRFSRFDTFNPQAPCGARQMALRHQSYPSASFNPQAPCGARLKPPRAMPPINLSIHRLLAEPDSSQFASKRR